MMEAEYTYKVEYDEYADDLNPRDWDTLGVMATWHRRYQLGDVQPKLSPDEWLADEAPAIVLPLFLMDHSGLSISTSDGAFRMADSAGWDWGQVGVIVVSADTLDREYGTDPDREDKAIRCLIGEVEVYDKWLRGEVFGFMVYRDGEMVDSCTGFFDHDEAEGEAKSIIAYYQERDRKARQTKLKALVKHRVPFPVRQRILKG